MIASAVEGDCQIFYSEDFYHGQMVDGVKIQNPFV
jgi:predicted nucleic acid-binding protein